MENKYTFKLTIKEMTLIRTSLELEADRCAQYPNSERTARAKALAELFNRRLEDALKQEKEGEKA